MITVFAAVALTLAFSFVETCESCGVWSHHLHADGAAHRPDRRVERAVIGDFSDDVGLQMETVAADDRMPRLRPL